MNEEQRIYVRRVTIKDEVEFVGLMKQSISMHHPWITPPHNSSLFRAYINRIKKDDHEGFAICQKHDDAIVGIININNIIRGSFQSATLGYYVGKPYAGNGLMREGLLGSSCPRKENASVTQVIAWSNGERVGPKLNLVTQEREGKSQARVTGLTFPWGILFSRKID